MKNLIQNFPAQLDEALDIASKATLKSPPQPIHNVLICGMGGSGIGANLIQTFLFDELTVPVTVSKAYSVPAFVSANTLVLACSYSGGTEETIAGVKEAIAKGAYVVGITSGGKLGELLKQHNFEYVAIPSRDNSPRAGIGYAFTQLLKVLALLGLSKSDHALEVAATSALLKAHQADIQKQGQELAAKLKGKLPILYADSRLEPVVLRTQQQIAENSKQMSHQNVFPEMNHNELVGWVYPEQLWKESVTILLYTSFDNPRTRIRMEICKDIFTKRGSEVVELTAQGKSFIEQSVYLIHLLDWMSYFLAVENGVDPFPVEVINYLKEELSKR